MRSAPQAAPWLRALAIGVDEVGAAERRRELGPVADEASAAQLAVMGYFTMPAALIALASASTSSRSWGSGQTGLAEHVGVVEEELRVVDPRHAIGLAVVLRGGPGRVEDAERKSAGSCS